MRKLIVVLVVAVLVLVGIDRVADFVAERVAADNLQSSQHLQQRPDVSIEGFPFLNQFATGHYQGVSVDAQEVRVPHTPLFLTRLHSEMRTVTVSRNFDTFHAQTASADATVGYRDLSRLLHVHVTYGGHGELALTKKLPLVGKRTVRFRATYANGVLRFGKAAVNGLGRLGSEVESVLNRYLGVRTSLRDFPFDVRVRSIRIDAAGLEFALTGRNLELHK